MPDLRDFLPLLPWEGPPRPRRTYRTSSDLYTKLVRKLIAAEQTLEEMSASGEIAQIAEIDILREKIRQDVIRLQQVLSGFLTAYEKRFPPLY